MSTALAFGAFALGVGDDPEVGAELDLAGLGELDIDRLVLAVGTEEAQVHRQPAARPDLLLDDRVVEDDLTGFDPVGPLALLDPVDEDGVGRFGARGQLHPLAGGVAALRDLGVGLAHRSSASRVSRTRSNGVSWSVGSSSSRTTPPLNGTNVPSPRTSTPATGLRNNPRPLSCSRAWTWSPGSKSRSERTSRAGPSARIASARSRIDATASARSSNCA